LCYFYNSPPSSLQFRTLVGVNQRQLHVGYFCGLLRVSLHLYCWSDSSLLPLQLSYDTPYQTMTIGGNSDDLPLLIAQRINDSVVELYNWPQIKRSPSIPSYVHHRRWSSFIISSHSIHDNMHDICGITASDDNIGSGEVWCWWYGNEDYRRVFNDTISPVVQYVAMDEDLYALDEDGRVYYTTRDGGLPSDLLDYRATEIAFCGAGIRWISTMGNQIMNNHLQSIEGDTYYIPTIWLIDSIDGDDHLCYGYHQGDIITNTTSSPCRTIGGAIKAQTTPNNIITFRDDEIQSHRLDHVVLRYSNTTFIGLSVGIVSWVCDGFCLYSPAWIGSLSMVSITIHNSAGNALIINNGDAHLDMCFFFQIHGDHGSSLQKRGYGTVYINNSRFSYCNDDMSATIDIGDDSSLDVRYTYFRENSGLDGGAISFQPAMIWPSSRTPPMLSIHRCVFEGHLALRRGGTIWSSGSPSIIEIHDSLFTDSKSYHGGGCISIETPDWVAINAPLIIFIQNTSFHACQSQHGAGALFLDSKSKSGITIVDTSMTNNKGLYAGACYIHTQAVYDLNVLHIDRTSVIENESSQNSGIIPSIAPLSGCSLVMLCYIDCYWECDVIVSLSPI
jgi:hypothetical protein